MRWPLRQQILLPTVGVVLGSLLVVSVLNAYFSVRRTQQQIEHDLHHVVRTLQESNFPLTEGILKQLRGLAGAEFVVIGSNSQLLAASTYDPAFEVLSQRPLDETGSTLTNPIALGEQKYFVRSVALRETEHRRGGHTLHVLYPEASYQQAWREAVVPPLLVSGASLIVAIGLSMGIALRVTGPLNRLKGQVEQIAGGEYQSVPIPIRNDEIADLSRALNRMSTMLAQYESDIRRNEQLRTLGQLGGGIAHQMRNAVTGCRLAIELHARECTMRDESLAVATRQLALMERYLQRFLALGRTRSEPHELMELAPIIENVLALVNPTARHVGVQLDQIVPTEPITIRGNADELEQLLVNLVINAVEAAAAQQGDQADSVAVPPRVVVTLSQNSRGVELSVEDTGAGPNTQVEGEIFDPFISEKPDGTGLGLTVAREIAEAHEARIEWQRHESRTRFTVAFPPSHNPAEKEENATCPH